MFMKFQGDQINNKNWGLPFSIKGIHEGYNSFKPCKSCFYIHYCYYWPKHPWPTVRLKNPFSHTEQSLPVVPVRHGHWPLIESHNSFSLAAPQEQFSQPMPAVKFHEPACTNTTMFMITTLFVCGGEGGGWGCIIYSCCHWLRKWEKTVFFNLNIVWIGFEEMHPRIK